MTDPTGASHRKDITNLQVALEGHPDIADVRRRFERILHEQPGATEVLDVQIVDRRMSKGRRRGVGAYLILLGVAVLAVMPWAWSFASRATDGKQVTASFLRWQFTPTPEFSMVLIVLLTAILGSVAVLAMTFSDRAGHETLERGYLWWYLTRPISAAGLALAFYMAFVAGFFSAATATDRPALIVAAAIGALAGLFTDRVLKKMYKVLGLFDTSEPASRKDAQGNDVPPG